MKTTLNIEERNALIARIRSLSGTEKPQWGKMNVAQMVEHCIRWEEAMVGDIKIKRMWLGFLVGKIALKSMIKDDKPVRRSMPTFNELKIEAVDANFDRQKEKWIGLLNTYQQAESKKYIHPFFGKMTAGQAGRLAHKHTDHHLRQFGR